MKNNKGASTAVIIVILAIVLIIAAALAGGFIYITQIRFDYVEASSMILIDGEDSEQMRADGYGFKRPFFANSASLGEYGNSYGIPIGPAGKIVEKNYAVYSVVNSALSDYGYELQNHYGNSFICNYTVENDKKILTVTFNITAYPDGLENPSIEVGKKFVFDIENASVENLPELISETDF